LRKPEGARHASLLGRRIVRGSREEPTDEGVEQDAPATLPSGLSLLGMGQRIAESFDSPSDPERAVLVT
jgi:hypothetical protein